MTLSVEDRLDILELLARADDAASARDADAYVTLFSEAGVLDGAKGAYRGRAELRAAVGPIWASEGPATVHLTLNAVLESTGDTPDEATATSTLLIVTKDPPPAIRTVVRSNSARGESRWTLVDRSAFGCRGKWLTKAARERTTCVIVSPRKERLMVQSGSCCHWSPWGGATVEFVAPSGESNDHGTDA